MLKNCLFGISFFFSIIANAQNFGGTSDRTHWQQFHNDSIAVIFPTKNRFIANRIFQIVNAEGRRDSFSLGRLTQKAPIILRPETMTNNGYVGLGPFRSEFFLRKPISPFSLGAMDWASTLSVHEFRHIEQYNALNVGLSKTFGYIFGQNGRDFANSVAVPNWFFEGDAVFNETRWSQQGRGRLPSFVNQFNFLSQAGEKYSYAKLRNGSYRDFVPNHYPLGYLLVNYGYHRFGPSFWKSVSHDAAAFKYWIYPFQSSIKANSGWRFSQFMDSAFAYYHSKNPFIAFKNDTAYFPSEKYITDYQYPTWQGDSIWIRKSGNVTIPQLGYLKNGKYKKLIISGINSDDYFSVNGNKIVYTAYRSNVRWENTAYNDLYLYDISSHKKLQLTSKGKYFMPNMAKDNRILVVRMDSLLQSSIVVIDTNRNEKTLVASNHTAQYSYPTWISPNAIIYFQSNIDGKMSLWKYSIQLDQKDCLLSSRNVLLGMPTAHSDTIFFTASFAGKDAAAAYDLSTQQLYELASNSYGDYHPSWNGKQLVTQRFQLNGNKIFFAKPEWKLIHWNDLQLKNISTYTKPHSFAHYDSLVEISSPYNRWSHPINFHSLQPDVDDPDYSLTLYGENILNTIQTSVQYTYNRVERYHSLSGNMIYGGSFIQPLINVGANWDRNSLITSSSNAFVHWNEYFVSAGGLLPLNFTSGKYFRYLTLRSLVRGNAVHYTSFPDSMHYQNKSFLYTDQLISYSQSLPTPSQVVAAPFSFGTSFRWRKGFSQPTFQYLWSQNMGFRGFLPTHNISESFAYQRTNNLAGYRFATIFPFSRGYANYSLPILYKWSINYKMPLLYPEIGFGDIFYLKRMTANLFYDHTIGMYTSKTKKYHFRSLGAELYFDTNWWNQQALTFGLRASYLLDNYTRDRNTMRWEFIMPISIF